jgi:hypothetical protein
MATFRILFTLGGAQDSVLREADDKRDARTNFEKEYPGANVKGVVLVPE